MVLMVQVPRDLTAELFIQPSLPQEDDLKTLIAQLPGEAAQEQHPALCALFDLACGLPANCDLIVSAGGIRVLLDAPLQVRSFDQVIDCPTVQVNRATRATVRKLVF